MSLWQIPSNGKITQHFINLKIGRLNGKGGNMTTQDMTKVMQRLEKLEKRQRRAWVISIMGLVVVFAFAVAIPVWGGIPYEKQIKEIVYRVAEEYKSTCRAGKYIAQGSATDNTPRVELSKGGGLQFHDSNGTHQYTLGYNSIWPNNCVFKFNGPAEKFKFESGLRVGSDFWLREYDRNFGMNTLELFYGYGAKSGTGQLVIFGGSGSKMNLRLADGKLITNDVVFQKEGNPLWRMFEDEEGLYLENIKTKKIFSFVLKEVK
jgi:hypothetical protein